MQLSDLPPGVSQNDPHIVGYPETQQAGECGNCGLKFDDLTFVWYEFEGVSECPSCESEIWIEAPEIEGFDTNEEKEFESWDR